MEDKYSNKLLPGVFIIKDISVWNNKTCRYEKVEFHVMEGILAGFKIDADYKNLDFNKIDVTNIKEAHFSNDDKERLEEILGSISPEMSSFLDVSNTFKIEVDKGEYFVIKDLGNRDYLSVDSLGAVYIMIHDPYKIDKIFESIEDLILDMKNNKFRIEDYY